MQPDDSDDKLVLIGAWFPPSDLNFHFVKRFPTKICSAPKAVPFTNEILVPLNKEAIGIYDRHCGNMRNIRIDGKLVDNHLITKIVAVAHGLKTLDDQVQIAWAAPG